MGLAKVRSFAGTASRTRNCSFSLMQFCVPGSRRSPNTGRLIFSRSYIAMACLKAATALLLVFIVQGRKASEVVKVPGWEAKGFPLSFAVKAGSNVYASGMQGMDMKKMKLVEGGVKKETEQILRNLKAVLLAGNSSLEQVTLCSVSLVNITRDFKQMNKAYASFWPKEPPARVAVQVAALAGNASVEIQCNAALNGEARKVVTVPSFPDLSAKGFPLSWATTVGGMVYLSGTQGMNMSTGKLVAGGVQAETTQALKNLEKVLEAANSDAGRVVACSVSLTDMADFGEMNEAYKAFWPKQHGLPSRVCVEVAALAGTGKVEIQCTAATTDMPHGEIPSVVKVPGWPESELPFSAAVKVGGISFVSGNQGVDMKTSKLVSGGAGPETSQTLKDIREAVEASGTSLDEVVACEVSLVHMKDFAAMNKAYSSFWPSEPPSRVAVQVGALARGASVEMRCLAALPSSVATNPTHYGNPKTGCQSDEQAIRVQGFSGDFCSPKCSISGTCPTDVPTGDKASPECALHTTTGEKYCALICESNTDCGASGTCSQGMGIGLCTYPVTNASATTGLHFLPAEAQIVV